MKNTVSKKWMDRYPQLLTEWDFDKNKDNPQSFKIVAKVWWKCKNGHGWKAKISNRVYLNRRCPYCNSNKPSDINNLELRFPEVAKKWNYKKNKFLPSDILPRSTKKVWWICDKAHEWEASPHQMTNIKTKSGCPYCKGLKSSDTNNIMGIKKLIEEWNYGKNKIKPEDMTMGKGTKVWWKCKRGHEWQARIAERVRGTGCPFCKRQHSLLEIRIYCELKKVVNNVIWCDRQNGIEKDIFLPDYKIVIETDGSYWHRNRFNKDLRKNSRLEALGIKTIRIREEPLNLVSKHDIICKCGDLHIITLMKIFKALFDLTKDFLFADYCNNGKILNEKFYQETVSNSLNCKKSILDVRPNIAKEWNYDKNGFMTPENMSYGSGRYAWFKCSFGHEWRTQIKNRSIGFDCPYCSKQRPSKDYNLATIYPESVKEWCYNLNDKRPEDFTPKSHEYAWWDSNGKKKRIRISDKIRYFRRVNNELV